MFEDTKGINVALIFNNNFNKKKRYIKPTKDHRYTILFRLILQVHAQH